MAYKALKNSDGTVCIDANGNILLVDMSDPGPTPPGPTPAAADFTKTYGEECLFINPSARTCSLVAYEDYSTSQSCILMRPFEAVYNTPGIGVELNAVTEYGAYMTEIGTCSTLNTITGFAGGAYPPICVPTPDILNGLESTYTLNLDNVIGITGLGSLMCMAINSNYNYNLLFGMFLSLVDSAPINAFFSNLGVDLPTVAARLEAAGHSGSAIFSNVKFQNFVLNAPRCLTCEDEGFGYFTNQVTLSFRDLTSVGNTAIRISSASVYINNSTTVPDTDGSVFFYGGGTGVFDLYVPQNMVAQYQASTDWNATNIYAYDFENNSVL